MARSRKGQDRYTDETWLIPYADMLTLLLALFIVLFAASAVDAERLERISQSLSIAFQGSVGVLDHPSPIAPIIPETVSNKKEADPTSQEEFDDLGLGKIDYLALKEIQDSIDRYIAEKDLGLSLQTNLTQEGLMVTILDNALFDSGSAVVRPEARELAREISELLVIDPPRHITVSGHTDNVPINTAQFPSNWDLSAARALNFLKILLENTKLDPARFSAIGYGEYRPVAPNDTPENRAKNRRVEILIQPFD